MAHGLHHLRVRRKRRFTLGDLMLLALFMMVFKFSPAFAQNLPAPSPNQNIDKRLSTTWLIQEQDVCVTYPAKTTAWDLTPSITEITYWQLEQDGTCVDLKKYDRCTWNYVGGYLQVVFNTRNRIYMSHPSGDFMSVQGVIKHLDDPTREGCFIGANQYPQPWTEQGNTNPHRNTPIMNNGQLPPPIYDTPNPSQQSPR